MALGSARTFLCLCCPDPSPAQGLGTFPLFGILFLAKLFHESLYAFSYIDFPKQSKGGVWCFDVSRVLGFSFLQEQI